MVTRARTQPTLQQELHRRLVPHARKGVLQYTVRAIRVGGGSHAGAVRLQGHGVELMIKSQEYKARWRNHECTLTPPH